MNDREANNFLFPNKLFGVETSRTKDIQNLEIILTNISPSDLMYLLSATLAFTILGICSIFAVTWIWMIQDFFLMPWCLATFITAIHFCLGIAYIDLIKLQRVQNWLAHVSTKSPPFTRSDPLLHFLHWLPVIFCKDFRKSVYWPIDHFTKNDQQSAVHNCHITPILFIVIPQGNHSICFKGRDQRQCKGILLLHPSLMDNLLLSLHSVSSVENFQKRLKLISLTWPFPIVTNMPDGSLISCTVSWILLSDINLAVLSTRSARPGILVL